MCRGAGRWRGLEPARQWDGLVHDLPLFGSSDRSARKVAREEVPDLCLSRVLRRGRVRVYGRNDETLGGRESATDGEMRRSDGCWRTSCEILCTGAEWTRILTVPRELYSGMNGDRKARWLGEGHFQENRRLEGNVESVGYLQPTSDQFTPS